eukprot:jgi/Botrbrau1/9252/Bobra.180_1s0010.2
MATPKKLGTGPPLATSSRKTARLNKSENINDVCVDLSRLTIPRLRVPTTAQKDNTLHTPSTARPYPGCESDLDQASCRKTLQKAFLNDERVKNVYAGSQTQGHNRSTPIEPSNADSAVVVASLEFHTESRCAEVTNRCPPEGLVIQITHSAVSCSPGDLENSTHSIPMGCRVIEYGREGRSLTDPKEPLCRNEAAESQNRRGAERDDDKDEPFQIPDRKDATEVPLACHTAINKRRARMHGQERYGDWYTGSEVDLDTTLLEYNRSTAKKNLADCMRGARRRKSAFPSLVPATSQIGGNTAAQVDTTKSGPSVPTSRAKRVRRQTVGPGQTFAGPSIDTTASEVTALAQQLEGLAATLLPCDEARQKNSRASNVPPLAERLKHAWKGLSYYDHLAKLTTLEEEGEEEHARPSLRNLCVPEVSKKVASVPPAPAVPAAPSVLPAPAVPPPSLATQNATVPAAPNVLPAPAVPPSSFAPQTEILLGSNPSATASSIRQSGRMHDTATRDECGMESDNVPLTTASSDVPTGRTSREAPAEGTLNGGKTANAEARTGKLRIGRPESGREGERETEGERGEGREGSSSKIPAPALEFFPQVANPGMPSNPPVAGNKTRCDPQVVNPKLKSNPQVADTKVKCNPEVPDPKMERNPVYSPNPGENDGSDKQTARWDEAVKQRGAVRGGEGRGRNRLPHEVVATLSAKEDSSTDGKENVSPAELNRQACKATGPEIHRTLRSTLKSSKSRSLSPEILGPLERSARGSTAVALSKTDHPRTSADLCQAQDGKPDQGPCCALQHALPSHNAKQRTDRLSLDSISKSLWTSLSLSQEEAIGKDDAPVTSQSLLARRPQRTAAIPKSQSTKAQPGSALKARPIPEARKGRREAGASNSSDNSIFEQHPATGAPESSVNDAESSNPGEAKQTLCSAEAPAGTPLASPSKADHLGKRGKTQIPPTSAPENPAGVAASAHPALQGSRGGPAARTPRVTSLRTAIRRVVDSPMAQHLPASIARCRALVNTPKPSKARHGPPPRALPAADTPKVAETAASEKMALAAGDSPKLARGALRRSVGGVRTLAVVGSPSLARGGSKLAVGVRSRLEKNAQRSVQEAATEVERLRAEADAANKRALRAEALAASEAKARKASERQVRELKQQLDKERASATNAASAHASALEAAASESKLQAGEMQARLAAAKAETAAALAALTKAVRILG